MDHGSIPKSGTLEISDLWQENVHWKHRFQLDLDFIETTKVHLIKLTNISTLMSLYNAVPSHLYG